MSASLVGSEMCIRDRLHPSATLADSQGGMDLRPAPDALRGGIDRRRWCSANCGGPPGQPNEQEQNLLPGLQPTGG
eukprot:5634953-Alexandrium_andersonii.AAC.1